VEQGKVAQAILDAKGDVDTLMADVDGLVPGVVTEQWDDQHRLNIVQAVAEKVGIVAPADYRLEGHATRFLELQRAKGTKARTYGELSESVQAIIRTDGILSPDMDVRKISLRTVQDYYLHLRRSGRANPQQKKQFGFFKRLLRYLWREELIELPRNLESEDWDFRVTVQAVKEYDLAEVKTLLGRLPDRLKLYALLGLNCGMLSVDVGQLRKDQIDFKAGRIVRKRTKTEDQPNVPLVSYKLWSGTLRLLRACLSEHETLALTTKNGQPLVEYWLDEDGKEKEKNMVRQQWKRASSKLPHKAFRSIGSTLIGEKNDNATVDLYLGHAPKSLADKHYKVPSKEQFDQVIAELGRHFGLS
jgi:integrase